MTAAGKLDRRVQFRRATMADDGLSKVPTWGDHGMAVWASRRDASDAEKVGADQVASTVMARFRVRTSAFTRGLTPKDRLVCDGLEFEIQGIKEADERGLLEITATAGTD